LAINKALNFPTFWENEVLLNMLSYLFQLFIYKLVISWRDVTIGDDHVIRYTGADDDTGDAEDA